MDLVVDELHLGTPESSWASSIRMSALPCLPSLSPRRLVVVAPHPDDEVFGAAGFIQAMTKLHIPVEILLVTDGEGSHPLTASTLGLDLRAVRTHEMELALYRLGCIDPLVTRLELPDGHVSEHIEFLTERLTESLFPDDLCVAPWWEDGHPDHDACGAAALAATGAGQTQLLCYLVWAWHWANPDGIDLPWKQLLRFPLSRRMAARKRWATGAYQSQTRPLGLDHGGAPLLPPSVLRRFWRPYEIFVTRADEP
jgi:LmbE family N-acetylglucosaminyl deacetylase